MTCRPVAAALLLTIAAAACSSSSPVRVQTERYRADLERVAAASREPGSAHWQLVQDLCADRFAALGFEVERQRYGSGVNVVGRLAGRGQPDEQVILSAHYDSVAGCRGADDNGTGVAGLFEAARVLAAAGAHARTLVVACWDEEELGLKGSRAYAAAAKARGDQITVAFAFEMLGYKSDQPNTQRIPPGLDELYPEQKRTLEANQLRGDFIALVHDDAAGGAAAASAYEQAARELDLPVIALSVPSGPLGLLIGNVMRSDHAAFWLQGYSGMMITDTADYRNARYHCGAGEDAIDVLDHDFATRVTEAAVAAARGLLRP